METVATRDSAAVPFPAPFPSIRRLYTSGHGTGCAMHTRTRPRVRVVVCASRCATPRLPTGPCPLFLSQEREQQAGSRRWRVYALYATTPAARGHPRMPPLARSTCFMWGARWGAAVARGRVYDAFSFGFDSRTARRCFSARLWLLSPFGFPPLSAPRGCFLRTRDLHGRNLAGTAERLRSKEAAHQQPSTHAVHFAAAVHGSPCSPDTESFLLLLLLVSQAQR